MAKIYDLMQERAALTAQIRELMNRVEDAELGAEDKTELARMEAVFDALNERIAREEKQLERERLAGEAQAAQARKKPEPADEAGRLFARALSGSAAAQENAALAAVQFQGAKIEPGESLSFNQTVGMRTEESGYTAAEEPAYGQNIVGVGGGICQVSTALYRLALLGGLEIAERSAAVYPVDYCEIGQEAAVSDQGLDLVLTNNTDSPLFLVVRVYAENDGQTMEWQLIGKENESRFSLVSEVETIDAPEEPVYVRDSEGRYATYADERIPVSEARPGYRATVSLVDENGETVRVVSEDTYDAMAQIVYVGVQQRN